MQIGEAGIVAVAVERLYRDPFHQDKQALFRRIAELLGKSPGIRPEDVFVNVLDAAKENWSVGNGLAQFS